MTLLWRKRPFSTILQSYSFSGGSWGYFWSISHFKITWVYQTNNCNTEHYAVRKFNVLNINEIYIVNVF